MYYPSITGFQFIDSQNEWHISAGSFSPLTAELHPHVLSWLRPGPRNKKKKEWNINLDKALGKEGLLLLIWYINRVSKSATSRKIHKISAENESGVRTSVMLRSQIRTIISSPDGTVIKHLLSYSNKAV